MAISYDGRRRFGDNQSHGETYRDLIPSNIGSAFMNQSGIKHLLRHNVQRQKEFFATREAGGLLAFVYTPSGSPPITSISASLRSIKNWPATFTAPFVQKTEASILMRSEYEPQSRPTFADTGREPSLPCGNAAVMQFRASTRTGTSAGIRPLWRECPRPLAMAPGGWNPIWIGRE